MAETVDEGLAAAVPADDERAREPLGQLRDLVEEGKVVDREGQQVVTRGRRPQLGGTVSSATKSL